MAWIKTIGYKDATGYLKELYIRVMGSHSTIDNVVTMHSLRPHTLDAHLSLYQATLHHKDNSLSRWLLEGIGTWVSSLNNCEYCFTHHSRGLKRELKDDIKFEQLIAAILKADFSNTFLSEKEKSAFLYAKDLTEFPPKSTSADIQKMREEGFSDEEILEINQVTSYFSYVNRTVIGLGCSLEKTDENE